MTDSSEHSQSRLLDQLELAEGDAFDEARYLAELDRAAHDQGIGPDYGVELHQALKQTESR